MPRYAISDIHGCPKTLRALLRRIDLQKTDELFLLGDYIDRGPDSRGVIASIWQLRAEGYNLQCLRGNHEQMLLEALTSGRRPWDYFPEHRHIHETLRWIETLPYYLEIPGYLLVHAGLKFGAGDPLAHIHDMLWARDWEDAIDRRWLDGRTIVYGHTPATTSVIEENVAYARRAGRICIDSGCALPLEGMGKLAALNLDSLEVTFQPFAD